MVQVQNLLYTPAGIPALNLVLDHEYMVTELDTLITVKLQVKADSFGAMAEILSRQGLDSVCRFEGFLGNARNGKGVVFHIQAFSKT